MKDLTVEERELVQQRNVLTLAKNQRRLQNLEAGIDCEKDPEWLKLQIECDKITIRQAELAKNRTKGWVKEISDELPGVAAKTQKDGERLYAITFNLLRRKVGNEEYQAILKQAKTILLQKKKREAWARCMTSNNNSFAADKV